MSKYLIKTKEFYRADSEAEAEDIIESAKHSGLFILQDYSATKKETKDDEYWRVTLTKCFTSEKDPDSQIEAVYQMEGAHFSNEQ